MELFLRTVSLAIRSAGLLALVLIAAPVFAADLDLPSLSSAIRDTPVEMHGFVSQGAMKTTRNNFLNDTKDGTFAWTEVGLNFTKPISERLQFGLQLFARRFAQLGSFDAQVDWYYGRYKWKDWLGFQFGRLKIPFGLYNDSSDIDSARVPILLPMSIYPVKNRDYLIAQTGMEMFGYVNLDGAGGLDYRLYAGTIPLPAPTSTVVTDYNTEFTAGGRLVWETPVDGLRLGGSYMFVNVDTVFNVGGSALTVKSPIRLWVGSLEYAYAGWLFTTEYSRWWVESASSNPAIFPNGEATGERKYAMLSYRVNDWFQPGAYYSVYYPLLDGPHTERQQQFRDLTLTLRFDLTPNWLVKLEAHRVHGTADLDASSNGGVTNAAMAADWGIFAVKTTAYF